MFLSDFDIYFSYHQFFVFDSSVQHPGSVWTEAHSRQGFARRSSTVSFGALLDYGDATVRIFLGHYVVAADYQRVISVPFYSPTGEVMVEGPEEARNSHTFLITPGHYKLTAAQLVLDDEREEILLFLLELKEPAPFSQIIVADSELNPTGELIENADQA